MKEKLQASILRVEACVFGLVFVDKLKSGAGCVTRVVRRQAASDWTGLIMPLTEKVSFVTLLQKGNRIQVPRIIRWQFKLESSQILKVTMHTQNLWSMPLSFYAKIGKDGRVYLPQLQFAFLTRRETRLGGLVMQVTLEPA